MSRTLAGVLAGCLVLAIAATAGAGIPDAGTSGITATNGGGGISTCPAAHGVTFSYLTVTALRADSSPIQGIPSSNFFFDVSSDPGFTIVAYDSETDVNGQIRFQVQWDGGRIDYSTYTVSVQIYTVAVTATTSVSCNTFDLDGDDDVDPVDFGSFATDFGGSNPRSDYDWDGDVDPVDFGTFATHFGH